MSFEYEIGDKVTVIYAPYGIEIMNEMIGKEYTIKGRVFEDIFYILEEDPHHFVWHESWLKPVKNIYVKECEIIQIMKG